MSQNKAMISISNPKLSEDISEILKKEGMICRVIPDGSMANFALKSEIFSFMVIESKLSSMNGFMVMSNLQVNKDNKNIPVFFLVDPEDKDTMEKLKIIKHPLILTKPMDANSIVAKIKELFVAKQNVFKYDVKIINAFIESVVEIFDHYFKKKPELGKTYIRRPDEVRKGEITGLIGITGSGFQGSLALNVGRPFCVSLGAIIFEGQSMEVDDAIASDLCGEICNQIVGKVKIRFASMGVKAMIGLPEVIVGKDHKLIHKVKNPILTIPIKINSYACEFEFCLDKAIVEVNEAQAVSAPESSVMLF